ncbi:hypothetical protein OUZ56_010352 [Daphnia magna]|uniref:Uncharacterized protein n=1 Tax=Daphnia magna TaxID=35525 RepID=A0ABR0AIA9_9CRUS|nr:hypothetical protein OUZ56_010352 [Daphnia magna]
MDVSRVGILSRSNVVADTESAIGSGSESHIGPEHWRAVFIRDDFISSGITEMDKVWRLKLERTRADVRFRYAANNGEKQHWTNIQHSNLKN